MRCAYWKPRDTKLGGARRVDNRRGFSEMAQEVNRVLVAKGIGVHHLALDAATLEAAFLKVTKNVKPWEAL